MGIDLKLYERPELVTEVRIGQILEAPTPSHAARYRTARERVEVRDDPTNIFGYVRGQLNSPVRIPINRRLELFNVYPVGTTLVERILPVTFPEVKNDELNHHLESWSPIGGNNVYLVIGELVNADNSQYDDGVFSHNLNNGSISLSPEQLDEVREQLLQFITKRGQRKYVFISPEGTTYSLSEIMLSLEKTNQ